jgi:adenosylcobinamide-GDP ribazoletransferase
MISRKLDIQRLLLEQYEKLVAATRFLSTLPLPGNKLLASRETAEAAPLIGAEYFPLVGLFIGVILALLAWLCSSLVPQLVLAALLVVAQVLLTGGLHLDGLMDSCDGLFGGFTRERKLEIMRDSRVGSFGVLGGACALLLKFACFASFDAHMLPFVFLVTLPVARWCMVLVLRGFPAARATGLGAAFRQVVTRRALLIAGALALLCALLSVGLAGVVIWCTMTLAALLIGFWITRKLGGLTGDTYGAISEIAEIIGLLTCLLLRLH